MRCELTLDDLFDKKERIESEIVQMYREVTSMTVTFPDDNPDDIAEHLSELSCELQGLAEELDVVKNEIEHLEEAPE